MNAILGEKMGMTQVFDEESQAIPVTVIKAGPCTVVQVKTVEKDGYQAVQLSFGEVPLRRVTKPSAGHFARSGAQPTRYLVEVRVDDAAAYELGQEVTVGEVLTKGEKADVAGLSKGKGFAGTIKRHNFGGQGAGHGTHRVHRAPGSIGACSTPSRVFRGKRLPGRMGHEQVTILNLDVVEVDAENGLVMVRGAVPGPTGTMLVIRKAVKARG